MPTPQQIDDAIKMISDDFDGGSGNCARFAAILNKVIGGEGEYLLVESGHYEFSDHVYLSHQGMLFDSEGMSTRSDVEDIYPQAQEADEDEDEEDDGEYYVEEAYVLEEFNDPSPEGIEIRKTVDSSNPLAQQWTDDELEDALRQAFIELGVDLTAQPAAPM
jgi:hypothetical protein